MTQIKYTGTRPEVVFLAIVMSSLLGFLGGLWL